MSKIIASQNGVDLRHDSAFPHGRKNSKEWIVTKNARPAIISEEL
jgi:hypothetical protein